MADMVSCTACAAGTYQTGSGSKSITSCIPCAVGTFQTGSGCVRAEDCIPCAPGTFQTGSGMQDGLSCALCAAGTYQTGSGKTSAGDCIKCPAGTFQTGTGMAEERNCTLCGITQHGPGCPQPASTPGAPPGSCSMNKTWPELVLLMGQGVVRVRSGGLGRRAAPPDVLVWLCAEASVAFCDGGRAQQADLACFSYHERRAAFDWIGWNSRLRLVVE